MASMACHNQQVPVALPFYSKTIRWLINYKLNLKSINRYKVWYVAGQLKQQLQADQRRWRFVQSERLDKLLYGHVLMPRLLVEGGHLQPGVRADVQLARLEANQEAQRVHELPRWVQGVHYRHQSAINWPKLEESSFRTRAVSETIGSLAGAEWQGDAVCNGVRRCCYDLFGSVCEAQTLIAIID